MKCPHCNTPLVPLPESTSSDAYAPRWPYVCQNEMCRSLRPTDTYWIQHTALASADCRKRESRGGSNQSGLVEAGVGILAGVIVWVLLALTGCSAKARIGDAAAQVQGKAASAVAHIDAATATGDVGPLAQPHLDDAKADIGEIGEAATAITEALPGVVDKEWPLWTWIKRFWYLAMLVMFAVLGVMYAPLRHLLNTIGSWFVSLIPKAIKVDAAASAEVIVANETGKAKATVKQIAAIERKKDDPRFKKVLDAELASRGVAT